jgi:hypothetical protein
MPRKPDHLSLNTLNTLNTLITMHLPILLLLPTTTVYALGCYRPDRDVPFFPHTSLALSLIDSACTTDLSGRYSQTKRRCYPLSDNVKLEIVVWMPGREVMTPEMCREGLRKVVEACEHGGESAKPVDASMWRLPYFRYVWGTREEVGEGKAD